MTIATAPTIAVRRTPPDTDANVGPRVRSGRKPSDGPASRSITATANSTTNGSHRSAPSDVTGRVRRRPASPSPVLAALSPHTAGPTLGKIQP